MAAFLAPGKRVQYGAAGITDAEVLTEVQANLAFAKHQETLWQRRFSLIHETEGDGHPRLFTEPMSLQVNEVFVGYLQRRRNWSPSADVSLNLRGWSKPYLPYTSVDLCAELLVIYRRYYPNDPPPNPERDPQWEGAARLVTWKVPEQLTSTWS